MEEAHRLLHLGGVGNGKSRAADAKADGDDASHAAGDGAWACGTEGGLQLRGRVVEDGGFQAHVQVHPAAEASPADRAGWTARNRSEDGAADDGRCSPAAKARPARA